eukprot:6135258-Pyramimonas_sp.AAC.2
MHVDHDLLVVGASSNASKVHFPQPVAAAPLPKESIQQQEATAVDVHSVSKRTVQQLLVALVPMTHPPRSTLFWPLGSPDPLPTSRYGASIWPLGGQDGLHPPLAPRYGLWGVQTPP